MREISATDTRRISADGGDKILRNDNGEFNGDLIVKWRIEVRD
jgi:hypothetical protein